MSSPASSPPAGGGGIGGIDSASKLMLMSAVKPPSPPEVSQLTNALTESADTLIALKRGAVGGTGMSGALFTRRSRFDTRFDIATSREILKGCA